MRLACHGLVHCDFNEFNLLISEVNVPPLPLASFFLLKIGQTALLTLTLTPTLTPTLTLALTLTLTLTGPYCFGNVDANACSRRARSR